MSISRNTLPRRTKKLFIATILLHSLIPFYSICAAEEEYKESAAAVGIAVQTYSPNPFLRKEINNDEAITLFESCSSAESYNEKKTSVQSMLEILKIDINAIVTDSETPLLIHAIEKNKIDLVKILVELGANTHKISGDNDTPLIIASKKGFIDIVNILIQHGVHINECSNINQSPLFIALQYKHPTIAHILIQHGADVNKATNDGFSPLMEASQKGFIDIVNTLIQHGAHINTCTNSHISSLLLAVYYKHHDIARILIQHGANVNKVSSNFGSPLSIIIRGCYDPSLPLYSSSTHLLTTLVLANAHYSPSEFNDLPDTIQTIIQTAEHIKENLEHQDWLPKEFIENQSLSLPVPASRAEHDIRTIIAEYADPINYNIYTPELCDCIALEMRRRHNQKHAPAASPLKKTKRKRPQQHKQNKRLTTLEKNKNSSKYVFRQSIASFVNMYTYFLFSFSLLILHNAYVY